MGGTSLSKVELVASVSKAVKKKLDKKKSDDGFADKTYADWLTHIARDVYIQDNPGEMIQRGTRDGLLKLWLQNLAHNLPDIWDGLSISDLVPKESLEAEARGEDSSLPIPGKSAIVLGRGPSIFKLKQLELLANSDYHGAVVCTDGCLIEALKAGVRPDKYEGFYSVTVDGNPTKIAQWYDHELVDKYGEHIKAVLCCTCSPSVVARLKRARSKIYWFQPIFDDYRYIESFTKVEQFITMSEKHPNGIVCMASGGHAGATAWVLSWLVLRRNPVALAGLNLGYLPEDDLTETYYWKSMMEGTRGNASAVRAFYKTVHNPSWGGVDAVIDPIFEHYRVAFLEMMDVTPKGLSTVNVTEGGALYGPGIEPMRLSEFLEAHRT